MTRLIAVLLGALAAGAAGVTAPALAQPAIGVSIGIDQPWVHGRILIGDAPPPAFVPARPVFFAPPRLVVREPEPVRLYATPAHRREWRDGCGRDDACGRPAYFVRDQWVREPWARERDAYRHAGWDRGQYRHTEHARRDADNRRFDDQGYGPR